MMCQRWRNLLKIYKEKHQKSIKLKNKGNWAKRCYRRCFEMKKRIRSKVVTEEMCNKAFSELMDY